MEIPPFVLLIVILFMTSPLCYLIGRLFLNKPRWPLVQVLTIMAFLASWYPLVQAIGRLKLNGYDEFIYGAITLHFDGLSLLLAVVVLILGTLVAIFSVPYMRGEDGEEKYYAFLIAMVGAIIGLGCASDLFNIWIWFEAMAITSYMLVAFYNKQPASLEAGIKYLMQSAVGSALVVIGIGLVLMVTGTLIFTEISNLSETSPILLLAGALFIIGFGVKTALIPLHTWLPDAHSQAPSGISAMLSGIVIEAGLIAMLRSISALAGVTVSWGPLLVGFGALNILVGNLMALGQKNIKRLLAYSSLSHVGYIVLGIGIALFAGKADGAQASFFHLINHGMMKGLAFLSAGALVYVLFIAGGQHKPLTINDLSGVSRKYPVVGLTLSLAVLGLGGIPPMSGFMSKWQILIAGVQTQNLMINILVVFAALNSVLSLSYYAPLVNAVYRREMSETVQLGKRLPVIMVIPLVLLSLAILAIGIWPGLVSWLTGPAGTAIIALFQ